MRLGKFFMISNKKWSCEKCNKPHSYWVMFCDSEIGWLKKNFNNSDDVESQVLTCGVGTIVCQECREKHL